MKWIRSPAWDAFWFLSGPAFGLLLAFVFDAPLGLLLTVLNAHTISPIALAWSHRPYRTQVMLPNLRKFVGVPAIVMTLGVAAAIGTWYLFPLFVPKDLLLLEQVHLDQLTIPLLAWVNIYAVWNLYHTGAQNFGFLTLYRGRSFKGSEWWIILLTCVVITVLIGHFLQRWIPLQSVFLFVTGLLFVNHWLGAIGLAAHVHSRHHGISPGWFVGGVMLFGFASSGLYHIMLNWTVRAAVMAACVRASFGIWHFLQDKWLWSFSNPQVRATIGRDLLGPPRLRLVKKAA
jgi:hypothetical protein